MAQARQAEAGERPIGVQTVTLDDVTWILEHTPVTHPVLLLGPPGVGKSSVVKDFGRREAARMGREPIEYSDRVADAIMAQPGLYYVIHDIRLSEYVESDFLGFPRVGEVEVRTVEEVEGVESAGRFHAHVAEYVPMKWALTFSRPGVAGLIFIDELTNVVKPELQSLAYKLVLDRKVGGLDIAPQVRIVGAGNTPDYSSIAALLPAPLASRFAIYYVSPPKVAEWINYIRERRGQLHPAIAGFLSKAAEHFLRTPDEPETLHNFPNPRSWDMLNSALLSIERGEGGGMLGPDDLRAVAQAYIGPQVAPEFVAFMLLGKYLPEYEEVAEDPGVIFRRARQAAQETGSDLNRLGVIHYALAAVANEVARRGDVETARRVLEYIRADSDIAEYEAVFTTMLGGREWEELLRRGAAIDEETRRRLAERARGALGKAGRRR
jgi:MoxR-like ATPase